MAWGAKMAIIGRFSWAS